MRWAVGTTLEQAEQCGGCDCDKLACIVNEELYRRPLKGMVWLMC